MPVFQERQDLVVRVLVRRKANSGVRQSTSKTVAKLAEQKRRREMEEGFNSIEDRRDERIRTIREVAKDYLEAYALRNRSATFAEYAIGHLTRLL
jgi:hypothetical protein